MRRRVSRRSPPPIRSWLRAPRQPALSFPAAQDLSWVRPAFLALPRRELVYPAAQRASALGAAQRPHRPGEAHAVLEVVADCGPSLLVGVLGFAAAALADGDLAGFLVLPPPVAQARCI